MTRILVTGFGAFPGARNNPTLAILERLKRSRRPALLGVEIITRALPVAYGGAEARLAALVAQVKPDAILHLGLAARRRAITIETRAINRLSMLRPDAERRWPAAARVAPGGRERHHSRLPARALVTTMRAAGARAQPSIDAGDYVCNQTLYLTLAATRVPAGFIHVPKPRGGLALATMARAIEAAALALGPFIRRHDF